MSTSSLRVEILDGLRVLWKGEEVGPGPAAVKVRALFRQLALRANHEVSKDVLVDELWERPPLSARNIVEKYVSSWRQLLDPGRVETLGAGYRLRLSADESDLLTLQSELRQTREALRVHQLWAARDHAAAAFALWSPRCVTGGGPAGPDLEDLHDLYLESLDLWATTALETGDDTALVAPLRAAWAEAPFNERLPELLMWAYARDGRQHESSQVFQQARHRLVEELGADPGPGLQDMLARVLRNDPQLTARRTDPPLVSLPTRNPAFVGRSVDLACIAALFSHPATGGRLVSLHGGAGLGKSALALEYAYAHQQDYSCLWWLRAQLRSTADAGLVDLAEHLGVGLSDNPDHRFDPLWQALARRSTLLVLDDASDPAEWESVLPWPLPCDVLVTTLDPAWVGWAESCPVRQLSADDAADLVARIGAPGPGVNELCTALDGHVLGIVQAFAYMRRTGMTAQEYLDHFRRSSRVLLQRGAPADHPHHLETTWQLASAELSGRDPAALDLALLLAVLGRAPVPVGRLMAAAAKLPAPLAGLVSDPIRLEDLIGELRRFSLVTRDRGELSMHYLTQVVIVGTADPSAVVASHRAAAELVVAWAGSADLEQAWAWLGPHLRAAVTDDIAADVPSLAPVLASAGDLLLARAAWNEALAVGERAVALASRQGIDSVVMGSALTQLGEAQQANDDLGPALMSFTRSLEVLDARLGPDHARTARALGGLTALLTCHFGVTTWTADQLVTADRQFAHAAEVLEQTSGPDSPVLARALSGWAQICQDRGDLDRSRRLQERSLAIFTQAYGADHPEVGHTHDKLAVVLTLAGDLDAARAHFTWALELLRAHYGPGVHLGWTLSNLSLLELRCGSLEVALDLQRQARQTFATAGEQEIATLITRWRIARILDARGEGDAARDELAEVVPALGQRVGPDHPDAIGAAADLARLRRRSSGEDALAAAGDLLTV